MNISLNSTSQLQGAQRQGGRGQRPDMAKVMAPVATALGMSDDELRAGGRSGKSLDELASSKGVSHEDLVAAIKQGLQSVRSSSTAPAGEDLDAMAERIATRVPKAEGANAAGGPQGVAGPQGARGPHGPRGPRGPRPGGDGDGDSDDSSSSTTTTSEAADELSKALGVSTKELFAKLSAGTSIYDLATAQGVSTKSVNDLLVAGLSFDQHA